MSKLGLICTFLCGLFSINSSAQHFAEGDSLVKAKQYSLAELAYERVYFEASFDSLSNTQVLKNQALLKKIFTQKKAGHFLEASQSTQRFNLENLSDSAQFVLRYETVVCSFLAKQFEESLSQIQQTCYFVKDSLLTAPLDFWEILTLAELGEYKTSKQKFEAYSLKNKLIIDLEKLYDFTAKPKFKDLKKAQALATFLPGAGLMYVGQTGRGITSLLLQSSALAFGVWSMANTYYVSGFLTGFALFQTFYFGGIKLTARLAENKNQALKKEYAGKIRKALTQLP